MRIGGIGSIPSSCFVCFAVRLLDKVTTRSHLSRRDKTKPRNTLITGNETTRKDSPPSEAGEYLVGEFMCLFQIRLNPLRPRSKERGPEVNSDAGRAARQHR